VPNAGMRALIAGLLASSVLAAVAAPAQATPEFADWTLLSGGVATGSLPEASVNLSGTDVQVASVLDGTSTVFNRVDFTPPLAASDAIAFGGGPAAAYTLAFGTPVTDPVLHFGSLASTLTFPPGTVITRLSGDAQFSVAGNTVVGQFDGPIDDANGTVRLTGTFTSLPFTATFPVTDGIYLQVGAELPEPPPLPPAPPPPPPPPPPPAAPRPRINGMHQFDAATLLPASAQQTPRVLVTTDLGGEVSQLKWYVGSSTTPVLVSRPDQNTLSVRPTTKPIDVRVEASGPGGSASAFQRIAAASSPTTIDGKRVLAPEPIYAAGDQRSQMVPRCIRIFTGSGVHISAEHGLLDIEAPCLEHIDSLSEIPAQERGIVTQMARKYGIPLTEKAVSAGIGISDAYVADTTVKVNGVNITPEGTGSVVIFPQVHAIASSNASMSIGQTGKGRTIKLKTPGRLMLDTKPVGATIPFGDFASVPGADLVPGFGVFGDVNITAVPGGARIRTAFRLPSFLQVAAGDASATVDMRATTQDGLILDSMTAAAKNIFVGPVAIHDFKINYTRDGDRWAGQGEMCLPVGDLCIRMVPPDGGVRIQGGRLEFIGATLPFNPSVQLFPGLSMERIGFAFGLDPTRFLANTKLTVSGLLGIDGRIIVAFPSYDAPYRLEQDAEYLDGGGAHRFPASFYGVSRPGFLAAASAATTLDLPVIGSIPLGSAYLLYEYPGYIAFGGGVDISLLDIATFRGGVSGEVNFANGRYDIHGAVKACLLVCAGGDLHFSSVGAAVCARPPVIPDFGVGIRWSPFSFNLQGPGCRWSPYRERNVRPPGVRAAQAPLPYTFTVRKGDPGINVKLEGTGGAPRVRVTDPAGKVLDSPDGSGAVGTEQLMVMRLERGNVTSVGMRNAVPGTYKIEPLPASPAVSGVATATALPAAKVTGIVRGSGAQRFLTYDVAKRDGQKVDFIEITAGGAARTLGTVTGGGKGTLRFAPSPGRGPRTIVAQFELDKLPAERVTVTRFTPLSPRLGRVSRLVVRPTGARVRATWAAVPGATAYEVAVTTTGAGQRRLRVRGHSVSVRVPRSSSGAVRVQAVATLRAGAPASRPFRASAARVNRVRTLPRAPKLR
jgi:hypothetical protein